MPTQMTLEVPNANTTIHPGNKIQMAHEEGAGKDPVRRLGMPHGWTYPD